MVVSHTVENQVKPRPVDVGFVVDKATVGQDFIRVLWFSPVSIFPPMLHTQSSPTLYNPSNDQRR
jgi:hypothetical protein